MRLFRTWNFTTGAHVCLLASNYRDPDPGQLTRGEHTRHTDGTAKLTSHRVMWEDGGTKLCLALRHVVSVEPKALLNFDILLTNSVMPSPVGHRRCDLPRV